MSHINIPIFLPELACRQKCIFCNQNTISGVNEMMQPQDIEAYIERYLATAPANSSIEIAFFGGSFTGIETTQQEAYLKAAHRFINEGRVKGIRLSTRPDYINEKILQLLKQYGVTAIELGAQSFNDEVLRFSKRGHTSEDTVKAALLIKQYGFELGLQMMVGLPLDSPEISMATASQIVELQADTTRVYPALVIAGTHLEILYRNGLYKPLLLDEAVGRVAGLMPIFEAGGVRVLRVGLHPGKDLNEGTGYLAGPYHPSFRELVYSELWKQRFSKSLPQEPGRLVVEVAGDQINWAVGFNGSNREWLLHKYGWIKLVPSSKLSKYDFTFHYC